MLKPGASFIIHRSSLTLALFELGIFLVDDVESALTTHDLTINRTFLNGWLDLHDSGMIRLLFLCKKLIFKRLFVPVNDPSAT